MSFSLNELEKIVAFFGEDDNNDEDDEDQSSIYIVIFFWNFYTNFCFFFEIFSFGYNIYIFSMKYFGVEL